MTNTIDPVPYWTRQLAHLRLQAVKRARVGRVPCGEITDSALELCDGLLRDLAGARLEHERLRAEVRTADDAWEDLFEATASACVVTDGVGVIVNANRAAGVLLSVSAKHLTDRELVVFSDDREAFAVLLERIRQGRDDQLRATLIFRPRERKRAAMQVLVKPLTSRPGFWLWFLTPVGEGQPVTAPHVTSSGDSLMGTRSPECSRSPAV